MTSPNSHDHDRIAQKIFELDGDDIRDEDDFNDSFDAYMQQDTDVSDRLHNRGSTRKKSWQYYRKNSKMIPKSARRRLLKGKTKQEKQQQTRTEKRTGVVRVGQRKAVPLYKGGKVKHNYTYIGKIKGRTVFARRIKTKTGAAYVDTKGRRVSVKRKKMRKTKNSSRR